MKDDDTRRPGKLAAIKKYVTTSGVPDAALIKMAKLGVVIDDWMKADRSHDQRRAVLDVAWKNIFGVVPCTIMSMMSNNLLSSACEVDICGALSMHVLALASRDAQRAARLEQQLRRRPEQGRVLPLQQSAQAFLQRRADGFPGDHRRHGGQGEHVRHRRRAA